MRQKKRRLTRGDQVVVRKLGLFGTVKYCVRVQGRAAVAIEVACADRLVILVSPLEAIRREELHA